MLRIVSDEKAISHYKRLLLSEWKKDLPEKVLALLWSSVRSEGDTIRNDTLIRLLNPGTNGAFPAELFDGIVQRVGNATRFIGFKELPEIPSRYDPPKRLSIAAWQANRLTAYLTLQANTKLSGDLEFFRDIQSLAFQAALQFVLPQLRRSHVSEHNILLHSVLLFPLEYLAIDPAHYCYLVSNVHGYLGDIDQRLKLLYASFRFTSPDDHSFLTKAQEFWSELLDENRRQDAEQFLFSLHWWCLPGQQEEVREMMVDALRLTLAEQSQAH